MEEGWNDLIAFSSCFKENPGMAPTIVAAASQVIVNMIKDHRMKFSDIERGLRKRNLFIWIFAGNLTPLYECRKINNINECAPYAMSVSVGSRDFFEKHDLKHLSRTYEENFDLLDPREMIIFGFRLDWSDGLRFK